METEIAFSIQSIILVIIGVFTLLGSINALMLNWIFMRLKSLGHEDRDIRNQIHGILQIMEHHHQDTMQSVTKALEVIASFYKLKTQLRDFELKNGVKDASKGSS